MGKGQGGGRGKGRMGAPPTGPAQGNFPALDDLADIVEPVPEEAIPKDVQRRPASAKLYKREYRALSRLKQQGSAFLPQVVRTTNGKGEELGIPTYLSPSGKPKYSTGGTLQASRKTSRVEGRSHPGDWMEKELDAVQWVPASATPSALERPQSQLGLVPPHIRRSPSPAMGRMDPRMGGARSVSPSMMMAQMGGAAGELMLSEEESLVYGGRPASLAPLMPEPSITSQMSGEDFLRESKQHMRSYSVPASQSAIGSNSTLFARPPLPVYVHNPGLLTPSERIGTNYSLLSRGLSPRCLALPAGARPVRPVSTPSRTRLDAVASESALDYTMPPPQQMRAGSAGRGGRPPRGPSGAPSPADPALTSVTTNEESMVDLQEDELRPEADANATRALGERGGAAYKSFLPLELFDNHEWDPHPNPLDWLPQPLPAAEEGGAEGEPEARKATTPFYNILTDAYEWEPCEVTGYDDLEREFIVKMNRNGKVRQIKRLNLRFVEEDPKRFSLRVADAKRRREEGEGWIRYRTYVDELPGDSVVEVFDFNGLVEAVGARMAHLRDETLEATRGALVEEVMSEYYRSIKTATLEYRRLEPSEAGRLAVLRLPPPKPVRVPAPAMGLLPLSDDPEREVHFDLPAAQEWAAYELYVAMPDVAAALTAIESLRIQVRGVELFFRGDPREMPYLLADFEAHQRDHVQLAISEINSLLLEVHGEATAYHVAKACNGGHDMPFGEVSERHTNLMKSSSLKMSDQLRALLQSQCTEMATFLEGYNARMPEITDAGVDPEAMPHDSIIMVSLIEAAGKISFTPGMSDIEGTVMGVLTEMVDYLSGIADPFANDLSREPTFMALNWATDHFVQSAQARVAAVVEAIGQQLVQLSALFEVHLPDIALDEEKLMEEFAPVDKPLDDYAAQIGSLQMAARAVEDTCEADVYSGVIVIRTQALKNALENRADELVRHLLDQIVGKVRTRNEEICERYSRMAEDMMEVPATSEGCLKLKKYIEECAEVMRQLEEELAVNDECGNFLSRYNTELPEADFALSMLACGWPSQIVGILAGAERKVEEEHKQFQRALKQHLASFGGTLEGYSTEVENFKALSDLESQAEYADIVKVLQEKLDAASAEAAAINAEEALFGWPKTDFPHIALMKKEVEPYAILWTTSSDFSTAYEEWMHGPFKQLDPEHIDTTVQEWYKKMFKLTKTFAEDPALSPVATQTLERLEEFKSYLGLIHTVCNPGLRERHLIQMSEVVGFRMRSDDGSSLRSILDKGALAHAPALAEISDYASREYSLEKTLDKMQLDWDGVSFELAPFKNTGSYILKGGPVDEAQQLLDDHLVKAQAMSSSPFAKPFTDRIKAWEEKLSNMQDIFDQWLTVQTKWMYLQPVFGSEEILKQMPAEGQMFKGVDEFWRDTMERTLNMPEITAVTGAEGLLEEMTEHNATLAVIEKSLNKYLETKKMAFPRFWFLSNDELLEILSETKDPLNVQPFVKKCFEAVKELTFESDLMISAMVSLEGEVIPFDKPVDPKGDSNGVEQWLNKCQDQMQESLQSIHKAAVEAFPGKARHDWILDWAGQVVLSVSQIFWTRDVAAAINAGGTSLRNFAEKCTEQLNVVVKMVRGELTPLQRSTIGALVVIDVHARDTVVAMAEEGISDDQDFTWLAQLRYFWEEDPGTVIVRMINAVARYGYEYLGNSSRLVITPLTDRCYRTLLGAIHLNLGGAPAGPAGTGKTETTKDLSKAIAIQCVVFNCSDGLDYIAMGKFFKGLASCGAWACFDEFNRIELEVLSVVAQQVLTIQRAIAAQKRMFTFEGVDIQLRFTCNVFITMNPGYAGRSELPDNLKALFRDVAMMVPDYAMISEIILYSFGYLDAREMGRKLVQTYRLCSEQLSKQDHYDYGMRAVMAVLRAAGNLKRRFVEEREDVLMLRAIMDVNLPKFLDEDVPLFQGILSDLFPGVTLPPADYVNLKNALHENAVKLGLQPLESFFEKIIQLYEMIVVRHGLMTVGQSFGMKTMGYRVLAGALTDLHDKGLNGEFKSKFYVINPKSITMGQLYGQDDPVSKEWTDGVLAVIFRDASRDTSPDRKWIILDGPVDAIWIENMNTVLDDNKKLCLNSGEIIAMQGLTNMIFEVQDLAVASPATVSRCGMVYVQPTQLGWEAVYRSWWEKLPECVPESAKEAMDGLFNYYVPPCLRVVLKDCKQPVPMQDINLVMSLLRLFESLLDGVCLAPADVEALGETKVRQYMESLFVFSLVWSIGGNTDDQGRQRFDLHLRKFIAGDCDDQYKNWVVAPHVKVAQPVPTSKPVYDWVFDKKTNKWVEWMDTVEPQEISEEEEYTNIVVTTLDVVRYSFLTETLISHHKHMMFVGPTGTGKTVYIKRYLMDGMDKDTWTYMMFNFSAKTSANMTQDIVDGKLDKRRKGVYGPPPGKRSVIFVDDLNMPQVEVYGAQPPIELLRQYMDHGGWYDRKELYLRKLVDVQFVAAMGPPGGGRNGVTNRYLRHFSVIAVNEFQPESMTHIFATLVNWWFTRCKYDQEITRYKEALVSASLDIYATVQKELLPTPAKSHYTFNLRDLSKVFQGIQSAATTVDTPGELMRLWTHEILRVFHDRLTNEDDQVWIVGVIQSRVEKYFKQKFSKIMSRIDANDDKVITVDELRHLMFGDFMIPGADPMLYDEIEDEAACMKTMNDYLNDYNMVSKTPMNLVLFLFAVEHVSRICRIIKQPGGHALLVGVGGSGRQSLTRLAASIEEFEVKQVEITKAYSTNDWRDDLKGVLRLAGESNKKVVFLFNDTQIKDEGMVEDISNLLNTSEVPNLFDGGDMATIGENIRARAKQVGMDGTRTDLYNFFVSEVKKNLHVVLCFSPVGEAFRRRLRQFPSLITCCTIDWFSAWPEDALHTVATKALEPLELDDAIKAELANLCVMFHKDAQDLTNRYLSEARRYFYVTPTSYLELLSSYMKLLKEKQNEVATVKKQYETGLEKLLSTEAQVKNMQAELEALQPQLIVSTKETEELMVVIEAETVEADKVKVVVSKEEAIATVEANKVKAIKDECEGDLAVAMPMLEAALAALDTLTKADITEVKGMKSPPMPVRIVLESVCVIRGIKPTRAKDAKTGKMVDDYWMSAIKMVTDAGFLDSLKAFDKDNIPPAIINKIRPYIAMPEFNPDTIKKASNAAYGLCCWVRAMEAYDRVIKVVEPKQIALAKAEAELSVVMSALKEKQDSLAQVEAKLKKLDDDLQAAKAKKKQLEEDVELCTMKLERATKLIGGLGGEKTRWTAAAKDLAVKYTNLTGDVLLSSAMTAYLGPFTSQYRNDMIDRWVAMCQEKGVPCGETFSLVSVLGNPVKIRQWNIDGLPKDTFSSENGVMMDVGQRWPLCIDPQGQTNKWIRQMEAEAGLEVAKLTDGNLLRNLENCIRFGKPMLLENVGETLDASLEPVLQKSTYKQGGATMLKLGDSVVEYSEHFRFYITTKLRNPHYAPEVCTKVSLLNFMITPAGLEDQLLGIVVAKERPELEEEKNSLILQGADNKKKLKEIESKILEVLSSSEGNILEDEAAVQVLSDSKVLSDEIASKQKIAEETEVKIDTARTGYAPIARHSSVLFFCVADMANIDPMYQYSLTWFVGLFIRAIQDSEEAETVAARLEVLKEYFTFFLYTNVCRSLFEKDKLLFSFLMATRLLIANDKLDAEQLRFVLTGGIAMDNPFKNPAPEWLSEKGWGEFCRLTDLGDPFVGLRQSVESASPAWRVVYDDTEPQDQNLPVGWHEKLDTFQRICVLRCFRPDKVVPALQHYVMEIMGRRFVEPQPFDLAPIYAESSNTVPLIFVLSPGSDPMSNLLKFADDRNMRVETVSLGQGQGPIAKKWIVEGIKKGFWVVLQNCHLAKSFLPEMEVICEKQLVSGDVHREFRLWLTSYPSPIFPVAILENSLKMTNEAPKGLRAGMERIYKSDPVVDPDFFEGVQKKQEWRKMLFGLAFFHCYVQQRRLYGPIGWNIPYEFNENDLRITVRQLAMFLDEQAEVPFQTLRYTAGECNYGGKVTDGHDRRTLNTILAGVYTPEILGENFALSPSGRYCIPKYGDHQTYLDYIKELPLIAAPEVFGLHDNANISKDLKETNELLDSFLLTQAGDGGSSGKSMDQVIAELCEDLLERCPASFDLEMAQAKYPVTYLDSMNTVLCQELGRVNVLLDAIRASLTNVGKAVKGLVVMSADLDAVAHSMFLGRVPEMWLAKSFPSLKPLSSYIREVIERVDFFQSWLEAGAPVLFWISGFFFTQAFMTGAKQNFARKYKIPIDQIDFDFEVMDVEGQCDERPEDGVYVNGMFLEGARWDYEKHALTESQPKVLFTPVPSIWMLPKEVANFKRFNNYNCPLYKTATRRGVLSTTGHSTNFVMDVRLPVVDPMEHWIKRGVAMLTSLSD